MSRLPISGSDTNTWGDILNDYLSVEHNTDGSQKPLPQSKVTNLTADLGTIDGRLDTVENTTTVLTAKVEIINEALPTLEALGAKGNDSDDDTAILQQAASTGIVHRMTAGRRYKTSAPIQLYSGGGFIGEHKYGIESATAPTPIENVIHNVGAGPALIMPNSGAGGYSQIAAIKLVGFEILSAGDCISIPNGGIGAELDNLVLRPGQNAKGFHHRGFIQDWRIGMVRIEGWRGSIASSADYGWYSDAEQGVGGDDCRMDDCNMGYFYVSGCANANILCRILLSDNVTWPQMRSVTCAKHGLVLAGGLGGWVITPNFEGNGYLGDGLSVAPTTGTITAGNNVLTVASAAGMSIGEELCIRGASTGIHDLVTTITNVSGTTISLASNAGYSVTNTDVTLAKYSDVYAGTDLGSPEGLGTTLGGGPQNVTFINPPWGLWPLRNDHMLRYAADISGITSPRIINPKQNQRPVYDPAYLAEPWDEDFYNLSLFTPSRKWQTPIMRTGWSGAAGQNFAIRRRGRRVEFRGYVNATAGATSAVCTLPPGCRPSRLITIGNQFTPGGVVQIDGDGNVVSNVFSDGSIALGEDVSFNVD